MPDRSALLLAALSAAPRRYRMPPLPSVAAATAPEAALAVALEAARVAALGGAPTTPEHGERFTRALAQLIDTALLPQGGDPGFQALVLRASDAQVEEYVRLAGQEAADRRALRMAIDAIAHPGKLRELEPGPRRAALAALHAAATAQQWSAARRLLAAHALPVPAAAGAALERLERSAALQALAAVQRYRALCERRGPLAGSDAAAAQGRASARVGGRAEDDAGVAFQEIVRLLNEGAAGPPLRVVRSLRTPRGFPGPLDKAKDEWDVAIVRAGADGAAAEVALLAEVKASPAAATPDFWRLLRGLQRLAAVDAGGSHDFPSADGIVRIAGAALRRLQPAGDALPPAVIYCCSAPPEAQVPLLSAATRGVLTVEAASLAYAVRRAQGRAASHALLAPVWAALPTAPRLRSALHQYQTARLVRAAMLQPADLLQAVRQVLARA